MRVNDRRKERVRDRTCGTKESKGKCKIWRGCTKGLGVDTYCSHSIDSGWRLHYRERRESTNWGTE